MARPFGAAVKLARFANRDRMSLRLRRVVTGHDQHGKACVVSDGVMTNVVQKRPGYSSSVAWSTASLPFDNSGPFVEPGEVGNTLPTGAVFRVVRYEPGVAPRMHRTDSTDYAIVVSGEIDMQLDDGVEVHLAAGDVIVQRGTIHNWVNRGSEPCVIAFVLLGARPVEIGNNALNALG
jgi:quercetin dioxygenase-like cupin family protein